jgi:hypothetical protein
MNAISPNFGRSPANLPVEKKPRRGPDPWQNSAQLLDTDIVSFCAKVPELQALAFALADHGHIFLGQVIRLTPYTAIDLADGHHVFVLALRRLLQQNGLDLGSGSSSWSEPVSVTADFDVE